MAKITKASEDEKIALKYIGKKLLFGASLLIIGYIVIFFGFMIAAQFGLFNN